MISKHAIITASCIFTFILTTSLVLHTDGFSMPKGDKATAQADTATGTVVETLDASGYTYMHVDTGKEKVWVAIPASQVKKGDAVTFNQGMSMPDFHSKTLDRSFDKIIFSSGLIGQGASSPHAGMMATSATNNSLP